MAVNFANAASASGAAVGVTTSDPADFNATGLDALTFTAIGKLLTAPFPSESRDSQVNRFLDGTSSRTFGAKNAEPVEFTFQADSSDAGQVILLAQNNGTTPIYFEWAMVSGDKGWAAAYVTNFSGIVISDSESPQNGSCTVSPEFETDTGAAVVFQPAP